MRRSGTQTRPPRGAWRAAMLAGSAVVLAVGCTDQSSTSAGSAPPSAATSGPSATGSPSPSSAATTSAPASAPTTSSPAPAPAPSPQPAASATRLPALSLPRLGVPGSQQLDATPDGTPTVINLWASWCGPCKQEMPEISAVADSAGARLHVLGVLTKDPGEGWRQALKETAAQYLSLRDDEGTLLSRLGVAPALPVTVLARGDGSIAYVYQGPALTRATLTQLVATHLGVTL